MQRGVQRDAGDQLVGMPSQVDARRWARETALLIRDFLHGNTAPDFAQLSRALRARDEELCQHQPQPAQVVLAHIMSAMCVSGISVADGAHILAAYLADERGTFSQPRMLAGLEAIGADIHAPTFAAAVKGPGEAHSTTDPLLWVAAAIRVWLDAPNALASVLHS